MQLLPPQVMYCLRGNGADGKSCLHHREEVRGHSN